MTIALWIIGMRFAPKVLQLARLRKEPSAYMYACNEFLKSLNVTDQKIVRQMLEELDKVEDENETELLEDALGLMKEQDEFMRWVPIDPNNRGYTDVFVCSNCGKFVKSMYTKECEYKYCPYCGKKVKWDD